MCVSVENVDRYIHQQWKFFFYDLFRGFSGSEMRAADPEGDFLWTSGQVHFGTSKVGDFTAVDCVLAVLRSLSERYLNRWA